MSSHVNVSTRSGMPAGAVDRAYRYADFSGRGATGRWGENAVMRGPAPPLPQPMPGRVGEQPTLQTLPYRPASPENASGASGALILGALGLLLVGGIAWSMSK